MQLKFFLIADERGKKKEAPLRVAKRRFFFPANDSCPPEGFPAVKGGRQLHFPSDTA